MEVGYNYRSRYNQIALESLAQRPGLVLYRPFYYFPWIMQELPQLQRHPHMMSQHKCGTCHTTNTSGQWLNILFTFPFILLTDTYICTYIYHYHPWLTHPIPKYIEKIAPALAEDALLDLFHSGSDFYKMQSSFL